MIEQLSMPDTYPIEGNQPQPDEYTYSVLNSAELRAEYITLTDELIRHMVEEHTDTAVFLDKSARPVAWMVKDMWSQLAPKEDREGRPVQMPVIKFINIDREQWGAIVGRSEGDGIDISKIPEARIDELRRVFAPSADDQPGPSLFEGKNVLVIDEVSASGDTLHMATHIFERAFPQAKSIKSTYWMHGHVQQDPLTGVKINTKLPVWYSDRIVEGRLVAGRDSSKSSASPSLSQRIGKYWLSTTFREGVDKRGLALKEDVAHMTEDLRNHRLPYMPSALWDESGPLSLDDRITKLNDGMPVEDYISLRRNYPDREDFIGAYAVYMANHRHDS